MDSTNVHFKQMSYNNKKKYLKFLLNLYITKTKPNSATFRSNKMQQIQYPLTAMPILMYWPFGPQHSFKQF